MPWGDDSGRRVSTSILACLILLWHGACGPPGPSEPAAKGTLSMGRAEPAAEMASSVVEPPPIDQEALQRASLLVITLDTTRPDHLAPYAGTASPFETPNLGRLASQGVLFERALATAPVTLPTHVSMFTGLDPPRHGVRNNGTHYLSSDQLTLAEVLQDRGFVTAAFVSAAVLDRRYGLDQGFSLYDDDLSAGSPRKARLNAERPAAQTVQAARRWLDQIDGAERFFLWLHLFDPHAPYEPPSPWRERFRDRPYDGEIAAMDAAIGSLLEHPRLANRQDHVVVVIGDHGESLGEHGESTHAMLIYDATLRIPWLMRLPVGGDGRRIAQSVSQIDLFPTLVELLLDDPPPELSTVDGVSLRRAIDQGSQDVLAQRTLYAETLVPFYTYGWSPLRTLRRQDLKYIEAPRPELYDLSQDPDELSNLALGGMPPEAMPLATSLPSAEGLMDLHYGADSKRDPDAEMTAKLRSLGYLGTRAAPQRARRPDPKDVIELHEMLEEAQHLFLRQDFQPAIERLRRALRSDAENLVALATLAKALVAVGQPEQALDLAQRALSLDPENPEILVTSGLIELSQGRHESALELFEMALSVDPRWRDAALERSRTLFRLGRSEEAGAALRALLQQDPSNARAQIAEVEWLLYPEGEVEPAIAQLREVIEREPSQVEAWRLLGGILEGESRYPEALEVYGQSLHHHGNDGILRGRLGALRVRLGDIAEGEKQLHLALDKGQGSSPTVLYALATVARRQGDWPAVEAWSRRALDHSPNQSPAWNLLAASLEEQGRIEEALQAYDEAMQGDPSNWQAIYNRALLLAREQRFGEARDHLERVLLLQPDHSNTHFQLGVLYAGAFGDDIKARHHLEASLRTAKGAEAVARIRRSLRQLGS